MSPIAALTRIAEHYEARSELYTSDADLAFGMFQIARAASGIETEGHDRAAGRGAEHESPTAAGGDAPQNIGGPSQ